MISKRIAFNRALQLQPFLKLFEQRGGQTDEVLKAAGLEHVDVSDPGTLIPGNTLYFAVEYMADVLGDPYFAARAAEEFVKAGPAFVRESYLASHTLAEFLPLAILELDRQISNISYSLQVSAEATHIHGVRTFTPIAPIVQADAATVGIWLSFLRLLIGEDFDTSRILVTATENAGIPPELLPKSSFLKRSWNGVQVRFPSEWLRQPLTLDWKIQSIQRGEFDGKRSRDTILTWLENECLARIDDRSFGLADLARLTGLHQKSLQRMFAHLGTSFEQTRDKVRREKALEVLNKDKHTSNEDLAEALSFSSSSSFSRAFKRWTGVTPSDFRRDL